MEEIADISLDEHIWTISLSLFLKTKNKTKQNKTKKRTNKTLIQKKKKSNQAYWTVIKRYICLCRRVAALFFFLNCIHMSGNYKRFFFFISFWFY